MIDSRHHSTRTGERDGYQWLEAYSPTSSAVVDLLARHHLGLRVCVTSFDSGPLSLSATEIASGWSLRGTVAVSPPLSSSTDVPHGEYDEWYLLSGPDQLHPPVEVFVNYAGFGLVPVDQLIAASHPSCDRRLLDPLAELQERFWDQIARIRPVTYVSLGDADIVVTRNSSFIAALRSQITADSPTSEL